MYNSYISIHFSEERLEWIVKALKVSHQDKKAYHNKAIKELKSSLTKLQNKMDQAYEDKLEGKISETFLTRSFERWTEERERIVNQISAHEKADSKYLKNGIELLELAHRAHDLYKKQNSKEKQRLLKHLLSNSIMEGKTVHFELKMPFNMIVETNKSKNWLGRVDTITNLKECFWEWCELKAA